MYKVPIKVAKFIKISFKAGMKANTDSLITYFCQFISGRQTAYPVSNDLSTLLSYKRFHAIVKYYLSKKKIGRTSL
jgi:hypothetical protein